MKYLLTFSLAGLLLAANDTPAEACGGCFAPSEQVSVVNAHRMVFSISKDRTILWDQFNYTGDPKEFAWVLPIHATGAKVELAHDEFIAALDAWSAPVITGPTPNTAGGGFGCGSSRSSAFGGDEGNGVQVLNQEVVGPYEVATLRSTDPSALTTWLSSHGYVIPESIKPTVAAYVGEGFDFIALRLVPGKGIGAMQPVRVITPGAGATLPLRMVAAGVGANVSILLYIISEGRYEAANYANTQVDFTKLRWNKDEAKSNYNDLIEEAMTQGDGRNFTIEFSGTLNHISGSGFRGGNFDATYESGVYASKSCTYESIWGSDFGKTAPPGFPPVEGGASDGGLDDAGSDGGAPSHTYSACEYDDLTTAIAGMTSKDIYVTRLRANLKTSSLSQDLVLKASADQTQYDNRHSADVGDGCATTSSLPDKSIVILGGLAMIGLIVRRVRRR